VNNRRVFVTGGASGLGRAIAERFARAGSRVAIGDVNDARGEEALSALRRLAPDALYLRCDVRKEEDLVAAARALDSAWGGVDVVVNNAGVAAAGPIEQVPIEDWQWILDINLLGAVRGCRVFTPGFKRQGHGHFVNVASMAGLLDVPLMSSYNASKAALVSLSETLQNELAPFGIGVTLVCPSFFQTNLGESLRTASPELRTTMAKLLSRSKLTAEDIADATFDAVSTGRFYLLPHTEGRVAFLVKRALPRALYRKFFERQTAFLRKRAGAPVASGA
jgi:NAD(P)-dependent dehydrogenase (short-subunit alcohol dehydrogenase family)